MTTEDAVATEDQEIQEPGADGAKTEEPASDSVEKTDANTGSPAPATGPAETEEQKEEREEALRYRKYKKSPQYRIDQLTKDRYRLQAENDALRSLQRNPPQEQQRGAEEPMRENYPDDLSYLKARQDFLIDIKMGEQQQVIQRSAEAQRRTLWAQKEDQVRAETPDYDETIAEAGNISVPPAAVDAMMASEIGPEIRYYLAKNPQEAIRLMRYQNPVDQIRVIGQIEAKIEIQKTKPRSRASAAPKPINPVSKGSGSQKVNENLLSDEEWLRRRRAQRLKGVGVKT